MPEPLVECIPNFSEARRPDVVEQILTAIRSVNGINILDHSSDSDHNRTVVTFVGPPAAVEDAAFQAIKTAARLIDLDQHTGEHPRLGATDVVPFVPISSITMQECVEMARRVGKRVGVELSIPVYLYEAAATRPDRQNLENIRRGEYELLKSEIGVKPDRDPDFGPKSVGPAGATVIGARAPLIAYNIYLTTGDVNIAQKIARAIRHSSGGFRYVKALGMLVEGRAQVSMNLTNFQQTPVFRVMEAVRIEAARYGVSIHHSELIGLIPQNALRDSAVWYLQLDDFQSEQVLEEKLFASRIESSRSSVIPGKEFLDNLAAGTPTPGGGSAAAFAGSAAASLVSMVARLTVGKKKYAAMETRMYEIIEQSEALRLQLLETMQADAAAFEAWMVANRLPKDTPDQQAARLSAVELATRTAIEVPLRTMEQAMRALKLALEVAETGNLNAISDAGSGGELALTAITAAGYNVRINCPGLDESSAHQYIKRAREIETDAHQTIARLRTTLSTRGNFPLE
ncbi:MAG: glutamate formimidoyltransferase [Leptolinea sp.]|nr:glutamate formimidoyltransferase [Leptolinea sp.]